jgi:hypothetical protein
MNIQGVTLKGVNVVDQSYVTSGLVYYSDVGNPSSYSGSGISINNISGTAIGAMFLGGVTKALSINKPKD